MNSNAWTRLRRLAAILASLTLAGCTGILPTGTVSRNDAGIPRICSQDWMKDQSYAGDNGDSIQQPGEDTPETVAEARKKNAQRRGYCLTRP